MIVPRSSNQVKRVAGVVGKPIVCLIATVVLLIVQNQVHANENASSVVANHQYIHKQYHKCKGNPSDRLILQEIDDLILIIEFLDPNQASRYELDKVNVEGLGDQRNDVHHEHCDVEKELSSKVVSFYLAPIINDFALPEGIVSFEETKHDVEAQEENYQYVEGAMDAMDVEFIVEKCGSKGKRKRDLYFHQIKNHKEDEVPE